MSVSEQRSVQVHKPSLGGTFKRMKFDAKKIQSKVVQNWLAGPEQ